MTRGGVRPGAAGEQPRPVATPVAACRADLAGASCREVCRTDVRAEVPAVRVRPAAPPRRRCPPWSSPLPAGATSRRTPPRTAPRFRIREHVR
ncbi:hypothetical protein IEQ44_05305 [Nocardioides sp. Y6]|uniref:Uncharacterized protein n=1 Tax=Nocardioides malaquae TaxID=2773426 RepID=A0ABR9RSB1_9ACTN|nr:hypothetical protein [Nocardioides malaquae]MBE7324062.1 hypothetical protein [Nocardioides malaquae]